jgi:hypothetical protein
VGSVTNSLNGLSYLTQPGGLRSSISTAVLQSASPQDVVSLSVATLQAQEVDGILGISQAPQNTLLALPIISAPALRQLIYSQVSQPPICPTLLRKSGPQSTTRRCFFNRSTAYSAYPPRRPARPT